MRFMTTSLSKLVDNLVKAIYKIKCKDCDCFLEYDSAKDDLINERCLSCNKDYSNKLNEELKNKFKNTFKFSNNYVNEFILLLRKGIYPYEHVDDWEKFNETTLPEKKFDSNLNMKDITDADYMHGKEFAKAFKQKILVNIMICILRVIYYFLHMFFKISEKCLKIYQLDPAKFLSTPGLAWQAAL